MFFIILSLGAFILALLYAIATKDMMYGTSDCPGVFLLLAFYSFIMFIRESYIQILDDMKDDTYDAGKMQTRYTTNNVQRTQNKSYGITQKIIEPNKKYIEVPITIEDLKKHGEKETVSTST